MGASCKEMDGNEAVASVAFRLNEVVGIYPITPASAMGELCDQCQYLFVRRNAACAAATRAIGTRNGEDET